MESPKGGLGYGHLLLYLFCFYLMNALNTSVQVQEAGQTYPYVLRCPMASSPAGFTK